MNNLSIRGRIRIAGNSMKKNEIQTYYVKEKNGEPKYVLIGKYMLKSKKKLISHGSIIPKINK